MSNFGYTQVASQAKCHPFHCYRKTIKAKIMEAALCWLWHLNCSHSFVLHSVGFRKLVEREIWKAGLIFLSYCYERIFKMLQYAVLFKGCTIDWTDFFFASLLIIIQANSLIFRRIISRHDCYLDSTCWKRASGFRRCWKRLSHAHTLKNVCAQFEYDSYT